MGDANGGEERGRQRPEAKIGDRAHERMGQMAVVSVHGYNAGGADAAGVGPGR